MEDGPGDFTRTAADVAGLFTWDAGCTWAAARAWRWHGQRHHGLRIDDEFMRRMAHGGHRGGGETGLSSDGVLEKRWQGWDSGEWVFQWDDDDVGVRDALSMYSCAVSVTWRWGGTCVLF